MKIYRFLLFIFLTQSTLQAQVTFQKGYFIDNLGIKTECLIKNVDWKNNPTKFNYKINESSEVESADISSSIEFGIPNVMKYIVYNGKIDRSSENPNYLSKERKPIYSKEQLFLKVLVEAKTNLYSYTDGSLNRFFIKTATGKIEPLVYKTYLTYNKKVAQNNTFRTQLLKALQCSTQELKEIKNISYTKKALVNLFLEYSHCNNFEIKNYEKKKKRNKFNLSLKVGAQLTFLNIDTNLYEISFDNQFNLTYGIEAEFIMPYNKNKWSLLLEPSYQSYTSQGIVKNVTSNQEENIDVRIVYKSIDLITGVRYYSFLSEKSKILYHAKYVFSYPIKDNYVSLENSYPLAINYSNNIILGVGYSYDKFNLEINYAFDRDILSRYQYYIANYNSLSVNFRYNVF